MTEPSETPWASLPPERRVLTVAQVRARCASLPPPDQTLRLRPQVELRHAGTLVAVVELDGEAAVVLTQRPATMKFHRGDWVFPGGRVDPGVDAGPEDAARRETSEELGIPGDAIEIVGGLDVRGPLVTGFVIHPFIGLVAPGTTLAPDPHEVAAVSIVPLSTMLADGAYRFATEIPDHDPGPAAFTLPRAPSGTQSSMQLRFFTFGEGDELWGTQGDILFDLLAHLVTARDQRTER